MQYYPYWSYGDRQTFLPFLFGQGGYPWQQSGQGGYPWYQSGQGGYPWYQPGQGYPWQQPGQGYPWSPPGQGYPSFPPPIGGDGPSQGPSQGPPQGPPPSYTPAKPQFTTYAVDPGGIRRCLYRYTYIWLQNGRSFWFYPVFVGRESIAGYRWRRNQYRWVYTGIDLDRIDYFECS